MIQLINTTNTHHSTIKMKPADVKSRTYVNCNKENNKIDPKCEVGDVRISKCKNMFAKDYVPNWSEEVFVITKVTKVSWKYAINEEMMTSKLLERLMKKELQKTNQPAFRAEKYN